MKLSNKGRYAVQAVFDLAFYGQGKAVQIKEISERASIPGRFLEQVFQDLKKAGVVNSKRGPRGGYQLACPADEIRLGDVVRAVEGPIVLTDATAIPSSTETLVTITHNVLQELSTDLDARLDAVSFQDLCDRARAAGIRVQPPAGYGYVI